jgi:hypothetical protein
MGGLARVIEEARRRASLPAEAVVVLAGREPPPPPWTSDPGWRAVTVLPLGELSADESRELVRRAGAPAELVDRLVALGHGHPLTLALLAEAARAGNAAPDGLADAPDLVAALVARVVGEVPSPAHVVSGLRQADASDGVLWAHQKMWLHRRSPFSAMHLAIRQNQPTTLVPGGGSRAAPARRWPRPCDRRRSTGPRSTPLCATRSASCADPTASGPTP